MKKFGIILLPALLLTLTSCEEDSGSVGSPPPPPPMATAPREFDASSKSVSQESGQAEPSIQKRIARTHNVNIETSGKGLAKRFEEDTSKCTALGCELISSNISENYGSINARILPEKLDEFLKFLSRKGAKVTSHSIDAQDKTLEYIDTDSRIRTGEALKERLMKLLSSTESKDIKAILEIEKEIARVQQEIDSAKTTLRYLSTITSMSTLNIQYQAEYETGEIEYRDLKNSFRNAWQGFVQNIASAIVFLGMSLPWIPIIILGIWIVRKAARFRKKKD